MEVGSYFLIAPSPDRYDLYCEVKSNHNDGSVVFHVINGNWLGRLSKEGALHIKCRGVWDPGHPRVHAVTIVPGKEVQDYNDPLDLTPPQRRDISALRPPLFKRVYATLVTLCDAFKQAIDQAFPELPPPPGNDGDEYFKQAMKPERKIKVKPQANFDDYDDDIPF